MKPIPSLLDCLPDSLRQTLDPALVTAKRTVGETWRKLRPGLVSFAKRRPKAALLALFCAGFLVASALGHIILTAFVATGALAFVLFSWVDRLRRLWQAILTLDVAAVQAILKEMLIAIGVTILLSVMAHGVTGTFVVLLGELLLTFYQGVTELLKQEPEFQAAVA